MAYQPPTPVLNPDDFVLAPPCAALDEFTMTDDDGSFVAKIDESYIDKFVKHMNDREQLTGDLCPLVIGHTPDQADGFVPETEQPPLVGYARSWFKAPLGKTGRYAAFFTPWIRKDRVQLAKDHPRRSCEVWISRYEADPISLLGATTPARDLGLMKLSRAGSLTVLSPGDPIQMDPTNPTGAPPANPAETGANKDLDGKLNQILASLTQLTTLLTAQAAPGAPPGAPPGAAPSGAGAPGEGEMSDADLDQLMQQLGVQGEGDGAPAGAGAGSPPMPAPDASRKGDKPQKEMGAPGGNAGNTYVTPEPAKMSRLEEENRDLKIRLSRLEVKGVLTELNAPEINPTDESLVSDLIALPPDVRTRMLERMNKLSRPSTPSTTGLDAALKSGTGNPSDSGKKRLGDLPADQARDEKEKITKLARSKNIRFEDAAREAGYEF